MHLKRTVGGYLFCGRRAGAGGRRITFSRRIPPDQNTPFLPSTSSPADSLLILLAWFETLTLVVQIERVPTRPFLINNLATLELKAQCDIDRLGLLLLSRYHLYPTVQPAEVSNHRIKDALGKGDRLIIYIAP